MVEKPELNKRSRIDWAVVGEPMNFVHLIHIGPGDMRAGDGLATTGASQGQLRPREAKTGRGAILGAGSCNRNRSAVCPASTLSSPREMLPLPVLLPESVAQGPSFPVCLIVPHKAWGLDSLSSLWLQPLLEMGSRQQD